MKTQSKATPGPWFYGAKNMTGNWLVGHQDLDNPEHTTCICQCDICPEAEANAQLIVRAVNSHDALLAACIELVETLKHHDYTHEGCDICAQVKAARAAIAQATGEA